MKGLVQIMELNDKRKRNGVLIDDAPEIIRDYLLYLLTVQGKSQKTVNEYFKDIRTFFRFIKIRRNLVPADTEFNTIDILDVDLNLVKSVTLTDTYEFMNYCINTLKNNAKTRSRKTSSLRQFYNYLSSKRMLLSDNPLKNMELPKTAKTLPKYLSLEESLELLNAVDGNFKERDYCIITLFLNCGLRLSELVGLNYNSIKSDNTMIVTGKGSKQRLVYLNDACVSAINAYKLVRPINGLKDKEALFISRQMRRMTPATVQSMVYKYLHKIGLDSTGYSVHKLRHTAATLMYREGVDIRVLKDILGHENLGTTQIYTHTSSEQMKKATDKNPLSGVKPKGKNIKNSKT